MLSSVASATHALAALDTQTSGLFERAAPTNNGSLMQSYGAPTQTAALPSSSTRGSSVSSKRQPSVAMASLLGCSPQASHFTPAHGRSHGKWYFPNGLTVPEHSGTWQLNCTGRVRFTSFSSRRFVGERHANRPVIEQAMHREGYAGSTERGSSVGTSAVIATMEPRSRIVNAERKGECSATVLLSLPGSSAAYEVDIEVLERSRDELTVTMTRGNGEYIEAGLVETGQNMNWPCHIPKQKADELRKLGRSRV
jgi:hypothetical protein